MSPVPTTLLPAFSDVRVKAEYALNRLQEDLNIDFKESVKWDQLKFKLIRTILGMCNQRGGGIVVIGVSERESRWTLTGINSNDLVTFDPDVVLDQVNAYADPGVRIDIVSHQRSDHEFLILNVREFDSIPVLCKRNGPNDHPDGRKLIAGTIYTRRIDGRARTERIIHSDQLREVLDIAAQKHARQMIETAREIGMHYPDGTQRTDSALEQFDGELEGL